MSTTLSGPVVAAVPPATKQRRPRSRRVIPGFSLTMGYTLFYLGLLVLIPLASLILKSTELSWREFWGTVTDPVVVAAYKLTFGASAIAAAINAVFGFLIAWVLVRYPLPGKRILDSIIDFPFALPTAVAGLTFGNLYVPHGWIGRVGFWLSITWVWKPLALLWNRFADGGNWLLENLTHFSWRIGAATPSFLVLDQTVAGVVVVLVFVGFPFVVRTVQPVLQEWEIEYEQAAVILGAGRWTVFRRVIFPALLPAWLGGVALSFARAVGEYGSVIFIANNKPYEGQIAPQLIIIKLDDFKYSQATAIALVLLSASLLILLLINGFEYWARRSDRAAA